MAGLGETPSWSRQAVGQLAVDAEGFGQVVLGGQSLHEEAVAAFSEGGEPDQLATGPDCCCQLGSPDPESRGRIALEGLQAQHGELVANLVDPGGVLAWEEASFGDEKGRQRGAPGSRPLLLGDGGLGPVDGVGGGFEVDPGVEAKPQGGATIDGVRTEDPAQLGEQRVQPGVNGDRVGFSPQRLCQFVAGDLAMTVDDQISEKKSALAPRQAGLEALSIAFDRQRSAYLDA